MDRFIYLKDVVTLTLHEDLCIGCGICTVVCPHQVFSQNNGKAKIEDRDACMECGACARNCPSEAIGVQTGVGCAAAVINTALGRKDSSCCCILEPNNQTFLPQQEHPQDRRSGCC
jgi:ferredoxin